MWDITAVDWETRRGVAAFGTGCTLLSWQNDVLTPSSSEVVQTLLVDTPKNRIWVGGEYTDSSGPNDFGYFVLP